MIKVSCIFTARHKIILKGYTGNISDNKKDIEVGVLAGTRCISKYIKSQSNVFSQSVVVSWMFYVHIGCLMFNYNDIYFVEMILIPIVILHSKAQSILTIYIIHFIYFVFIERGRDGICQSGIRQFQRSSYLLLAAQFSIRSAFLARRLYCNAFLS